MIPYTAPIADMRFVLNEIVGLDRLSMLHGHETVTPDLVDAVLEQAGRLAGDVLAPINDVGDRNGSILENGVVRTPPGFKEAYRAYVDGGWNALPFEPEHGGQGLPWAVAFAVQEMWQSSNMGFGLCPLLTQGAIEALTAHASDEIKATYLEKMVSGEWTGTMNLTEPQAGSDLAAVRTRAVRGEDGTYRIHGQKIFITYGEHDFTENIVHLVLARLPDAPAGVKGISLFVVPKFLVEVDGTLGRRNDLRCVSLEHKLGIRASPTAVMAYGDNEGAVGFIVGEENRGLEYMFTMMNNARLAVGLQGVAIAERAYQQARDYARSRVQGRPLNGKGDKAAIINHPDVRRMLMTMKAGIEAARALTYMAAAALDTSKKAGAEEQRRQAQALVDLLTPVVKAWCTDLGVEVASLGIQVHGGVGFIEETGAAQHLRDARINPIYEGTNGIQANDLVFRKVLRDGGASVRGFLQTMRGLGTELDSVPGDDAEAIKANLSAALDALESATDWLLATGGKDPQAASAGAAHYLRLFGLAAGGYVMAKAAIAAQAGLGGGHGADAGFLEAKLITARFYADQLLPQAVGLLDPITKGHGTVMALADAQF